MDKVNINWMGEDITLIPKVDIYKKDNTTRITFFEENEGPFNTLTTCINAHGNMQNGLIVVKNYSENIPIVKELLRIKWMTTIDKLYIGKYNAEVLLCLVKEQSVLTEINKKYEELK